MADTRVIYGVYIAEAESLYRYKIGCAAFPEPRIHALSTQSPVPIRLLRVIHHIDAKSLERMLHSRYKEYRIHGEWFDLPVGTLNALLIESFDTWIKAA